MDKSGEIFMPELSLSRWIACLALAVAGCSSSPPAPTVAIAEPPGPVLFDDATAESGIDFTYRNGEDAGHFAIIESIGGGVALFDYDGDGRIDIFFTGGGRYEGKKAVGLPGRLYRNLGNFKFEDVTKAAGLDAAGQYSHGAAAFDYDRDGRTDLLITGYNRLILYRNLGGRFVDVAKAAKLDDALWSTTAGWGDLDGDGFPEIYVSHYGDWGFETNHPADCSYDGKTRDVCQPRRFKPLPHTLYKNNGDGTFTDVSASQKLRTDGKGMGVLFADLTGDTRPDIYVANDTDDNFLYVNKGGGKTLALEEAGLQAGTARDDRGSANGSMGLDAADFDCSGRASLIVSNYEGELPALYINRTEQKPRFIYGSLDTRLAAVGGVHVGWGIGFQDFDLDGWEDLMMVNGHAIRFPTKIDRRQKPVLFQNENGKFSIISHQGGKYFQSPHNARGLAFADLDDDGRVDCVISHLNEPVAVLRNVAPKENRHWIGLELIGAKNRDLVGARVAIENKSGVQTRFVKGGGSFGSTHDRRFVVGLGANAAVPKVTVHWPGGAVQEFKDLKMDGYSKLVEK
jgi:hypothetical protein